MSAAETIAYQRATEKGQDGEPLEGDKLEAAQTKFRLADAYRTAVQNKDQKAKEQARKDIDDARKADKITVSDEEQMMLARYKYPTRLAAKRRPNPQIVANIAGSTSLIPQSSKHRAHVNNSIGEPGSTTDWSKKSKGPPYQLPQGWLCELDFLAKGIVTGKQLDIRHQDCLPLSRPSALSKYPRGSSYEPICMGRPMRSAELIRKP